MRRFLVIATLLAAGTALAVGFTINSTTKVVFTDCAAGGSAAQTIVEGPTWVRTSSAEGLFMCIAASGSTCASGGDFLPPNSSLLINFSSAQISVSCRSAAATGDLYLTAAL